MNLSNEVHRKKRWVAEVWVKKKRIFLKRFYTEIEAAIAYNEMALKYHGEFARLNIIQENV